MAVARRTMQNTSFGPFSKFFFSSCVLYIITIIEMLSMLQLYRGTIRRLQRGKMGPKDMSHID